MVFASPLFLFLFLPLAVVGYLVMPRVFKNFFLLIASLLFYAWGDPHSILLLLAIILINYQGGILIERSTRQGGRILVGAIIANIGLLLYQKYTGGLSLGISFITFRALSYIIDIFTKKTSAEKNLLSFALYMTLFPHMVAGPIVRLREIQKEIYQRTVTAADFTAGLARFIRGLGKKVIIANTLGKTVDMLFVLPATDLTTPIAWIAVVSYALQIYFDFSGYSDMAIGLARIFGFHFPENFNYPYISRSITEFWRRWHISLSSWFRDYVYFPLGGNRKGESRTYSNILIVFFLTGFWHGSTLNFIIWGLYFGIILCIEKAAGKKIEQSWRPLQHLYALLIVLIGWVFFRAASLPQALGLIKTMAGFTATPAQPHPLFSILTNEFILVFVFACITSVPLFTKFWTTFEESLKQDRMVPAAWIRVGIAWIMTTMILIYSLMHMASATHNPFIYFKF